MEESDFFEVRTGHGTHRSIVLDSAQVSNRCSSPSCVRQAPSSRVAGSVSLPGCSSHSFLKIARMTILIFLTGFTTGVAMCLVARPVLDPLTEATLGTRMSRN